MPLEPTFAPSLCREGPFAAATPHLEWVEWVGAPESARLLGRDPSEWIWSMSRLQTIDAAQQLQHDACLMTSSLNVLDQYALCLQGTASELLELVVRRHDFPSTVMDSAAPVPRVLRASVHMEVMGHWRPPLGPD